MNFITTPQWNSKITWSSKFDGRQTTLVYVSDDYVTMEGRCVNYYRVTTDNNNLRAVYHNPKGGDLFIQNGMVTSIGWGNNVGILHAL